MKPMTAPAQPGLSAKQRRLPETELTRERDNLRLLIEVGNALSAHLELRDLFAAIFELHSAGHAA